MDFKIPSVGENIESGTVVSIMVKEGDNVTKDQDLLELETDKASLPVPSPVDGVIKSISIKEGDEVKIGQSVMSIEEGVASTSPDKSDEQKETKSDEPISNSTKPEAKTSSAASEDSDQKETQPKASSSTPPSSSSSNFNSTQAHKDVPAAPSVRRLAREIGIDITQVPGSGAGGRINKDDVKAYAKQLNEGRGSTGSGAGFTTPALPDFSKWGSVKREPMSKIRQVTAKHMSTCWNTVPHVTQFGKADITDLEKLRKRYSTSERKLTVTPFLLKVMASALKKFPQFNASIDQAANEIIYKDYVNIGVAVDTDRGLLVPVLKDVDQKSIYQINDEVNELAEKARSKKVSLDELKGGSMTLTNLGGIYGTSFTPIVNWPEVAILGVSRGSWEPVYENNQFVPRFMLPFSLSYDHRLIDGADGARFLKWICEAIEQPFIMELNS